MTNDSLMLESKQISLWNQSKILRLTCSERRRTTSLGDVARTWKQATRSVPQGSSAQEEVQNPKLSDQ